MQNPQNQGKNEDDGDEMTFVLTDKDDGKGNINKK